MSSLWELFVSLGWGLSGWYLPKILLASLASTIARRDVSDVVQFVHDNNNNNNNNEKQPYVLDFQLNRPLVDPPTIPSHVLEWTAVWFPLVASLAVVMVVGRQGRRQQQQRWALSSLPDAALVDGVLYRQVLVRTTLCAWATAIGTSEGLTQMCKLYVQRRRPNFIALCGLQVQTSSNNNNNNNNILATTCTAPTSHIVEAHLSFPSGHSSLTACGMTFLFLLVASQVLSSSSSRCLGLSWRTRRAIIVVTALTTVSWTLWVGTSRLVDTWHHPSDVVAGWGLGLASSVAAFCVWFPPLWHVHVGIPWSVVLVDDSNKSSSSSGGGGSGMVGSSSLLLPMMAMSSSTSSVSSVKQASFHE